jgi:hypothetical protein
MEFYKDLIIVVCVSEPDTQYTTNKKLQVGDKYLARIIREKIKSPYKTYYVNLCDIYDLEGLYMGNYFAKDFMSIPKWINKERDSKIDEILR